MNEKSEEGRGFSWLGWPADGDEGDGNGVVRNVHCCYYYSYYSYYYYWCILYCWIGNGKGGGERDKVGKEGVVCQFGT